MRNYSALILFTILTFCTFNATCAEDTTIFKSLNCGICHKADTGKAYPSLVEITKAYNGDKEKLTGYLQGKNEPIINKEKAASMDKYIEKTKALLQEELGALVDFILSNK